MNVKGERFVGRTRVSVIVGNIFAEIVAIAVGVVAGCGVLPFGAMPFGFAILCAASRCVPSIFIGLIISSFFFEDTLLLLAVYTVTFSLRLLTFALSRRKSTIFEEHISLRITTAALGALVLGAYKAISGGLLYYYIFSMLIGVLVSAAATLLWCALPRPFDKRDGASESRHGLWKIAAIVSACAACTWTLRGMAVLGISLSALFAIFAVLISTRRCSIAVGTLMGTACGLCVSVIYTPIFALGAVSFGLLREVSLTLASFSVLLIGMGWGVYTTGIEAISSLFPALLLASVMFIVIERLFGAKDTEKSTSAKSEVDATDKSDAYASNVAAIRLDGVEKSIKELCGALHELSGEFEDTVISAPGKRDILAASLNAEIGDEGVSVKEKRTHRYGRTAKKEESAYKISDITRYESPCADGVLLGALSEYLADIMQFTDSAAFSEFYAREELERVAREKYGLADATVIEYSKDGKILLSCEDLPRLERYAGDICEDFSKKLDTRLACGDVFDIGRRAYAIYEHKTVYKVTYSGKRMASPEDPEHCGDSFGVINRGQTDVYAFICDGMGSGRDAAATSELCANFLNKMLRIPVPVKSTVALLNTFLRSRNGNSVKECAATVDLCRIKLDDGRAEFYKSGAAPTYIFRDGSLFKTGARTVPIGILKELDTAKSTSAILPGDVIVMMSDGVTEGRDECPELFEFIRTRIATHSPEQLSDAIMDYAKQRRITDDASVVVLRIEENLFQ